MAKAKKLPTMNEQEYEKELRRLKQFIRRATKRGFIFPINAIPERPKRITQASVNRLKKITPSSLYRKATPPAQSTSKHIKASGGIKKPTSKGIENPTVRGISNKKPNIKYSITAPENIRKEYSKQRTRVREFMRRAGYRGYTFPDGILPTTRAQYATQELVDYLKGLTPQKLYEKAQYKDPLTDDVMSGVEGRKLERQRAAKKAQETHRKNIEAGKKFRRTPKKKKSSPDKGKANPPEEEDADEGEVILRNIREQIAQWSLDPSWSKDLTRLKELDKNRAENILNGAINEDGEIEVARRLKEHGKEVNAILEQVLYGSGGKGNAFETGREAVNFDLVRFSAIVKGRPLTVEESKDITDAAETLEVNN